MDDWVMEDDQINGGQINKWVTGQMYEIKKEQKNKHMNRVIYS